MHIKWRALSTAQLRTEQAGRRTAVERITGSTIRGNHSTTLGDIRVPIRSSEMLSQLEPREFREENKIPRR